MDLHPTPFPGKVRPANLIKKDGGNSENKNSKDATLVPARYRQKRVLGISKSTNILVKTGEKPLSKPSTKTIRKPKPLEPSSKPIDKDFPAMKTKSARNHEIMAVYASPHTSREKIKVEMKKNNVCFQEPLVKSLATNVKEDLVCTPVSSIKPVAVSTPYQSAGNCSKCRFDRLESSSYWLTQIKIAESVGKHFVSATFFRLALECSAEPFRSLLRQLKCYVARHESISNEALWRDVLHTYGLLNDGSETKTGSLASALEKAISGKHGGCNLNKIVVLAEEDDDLKTNVPNEKKKPEILRDDDTDSMVISKTEPIKQSDDNISNLKDNGDGKEFGDANEDMGNEDMNNLKLDSSKEILSDDKTSNAKSISEGGMKKAFDGRKGATGEGSSAVGKLSFGKKNGGVPCSHGDSSPSDHRKHKSDESVEKTGKNRAGARASQGDRPMR